MSTISILLSKAGLIVKVDFFRFSSFKSVAIEPAKV